MNAISVKALLVGAVFAIACAGYGSGAAAGNIEFRTIATGAQEIQPPGWVDTDTRARLDLKFNRGLSAARFDLRVFDGEEITQAHLHCARAGLNGQIVVFLFDDFPLDGTGGGVDVDGRLARGKITNAEIEDVAFEDDPNCGVAINNIASLLAAILDGLIYLNVHSVANTAGEVRGQIFDVNRRDDDDDD